MEKERNISELLFEKYLTLHSHNFDYEPLVEGKSAKLDYRVIFNGVTIFFDVKEFQQDIPVIPMGEIAVSIGGYDPYKYVREKLEGAWTQLSQYKEYPCSVVLYNHTHTLVMLTPETVLGAMLGTLTYSIDSNGQLNQFFGEPGSYRTAYLYDADGPRETPIIAVIVIEEVIVVPTEFTQMLDDQIKLLPEDYDEVAEAVNAFNNNLELSQRGIVAKKVPRVVVYENPHANIHFPRDMFIGPYDERWGKIEDGKIEKIFEGERLGELQQTNLPADELCAILQRKPQGSG